MKKRLSLLIAILISWNLSQPLLAHGLAIALGPPAIGNGGPNPVGIPPQLVDVGLTYVNSSSTEFQLALIGLMAGKRFKYDWGGYLGLGGGLILSTGGVGFGPYSLVGYDLLRMRGNFSIHIEYLQAIGITSTQLVSPYVLRLGVGKWF